MRPLQACAFAAILIVASNAVAESKKTSVALEFGFEFDRGLVHYSGSKSPGLGVGIAIGGDLGKRLWLGGGFGSSLSESGEWGSVPRVFSLCLHTKWWFAGRDARVYFPAAAGVAGLVWDNGYSSQTWAAPLILAGLGVSISKRFGLEARYSRTFEVEKRSYRETDRSFSSSGVYLVIKL